jgi:hypothetical protein
MNRRRPDYRKDRAERLAKAKLEGGLSYTEIALNPNLNPERITPQRIQQIIKDWQRYEQTNQEIN